MNFELFEKKSENPDFVMTRCAGNVMTACAYAKTNGDIALIYGEAGLGKTAPPPQCFSPPVPLNVRYGSR